MNPQTLVKLNELPEFREVLEFIRFEAQNLDKLPKFDSWVPLEIAVQVRSQELASNTLKAILSQLLAFDNQPKGTGQSEYAVE